MHGTVDSEGEGIMDRIEPRRMSNILLYGSIGFMALLLLWAALARIDQTIHAQGRVVPTAQLQQISNLEGGIIEKILVDPGDEVKEGEPLVQIDPTMAESDYSASSMSLASLEMKIERLRAEVVGQPPKFPAPQNAEEARQLEIERALYQSRQSDLASALQGARSRVVQSQRAVAEAEANYQAAITSRDSARQQAELLRPLVNSGIEPQMSLIQAERQASVGASQANAAMASLARAQSSVAEAQASLAQVRQDWRSQAAGELAAVQAEAASRQQAQPALESRLDRTLVRAPLAGKINRVLVHTIGGTVRPGEALVEIVPSRSGLTMEAAVRPQDIAFVRVGQRALVKITAYDYSIYGGMEGKVTGISPDAIVNERTGETYYMVKIRTPADTLTSPGGQRLPITPGMTADINLVGDSRSVLSYILRPFTKLSEHAFRE